MKKTRRIISVVLSFLILLSAVSAFSIAFAQEADEKKTESVINNVKTGKITLDESAATILSAYDKLVSSGKELTAEQEKELEELQALVKEYGDKTADTVLKSLDSIAGMTKDISAAKFGLSSDKKVAAVETMIDSFSGKLSISKPADIDKISAEDIKAYDDIISAYNALSDTQKDSLNIFMFDKMLHLIYDREAAKLIVGGMTSSNASKLVNSKVKDVIGEVEFLTKAATIGAVLKDSKATPEEKLEAYKTASNEKERIYAGLWYSGYSQFYYKAETSTSTGFCDVVNAFAKRDITANPFSDAKPDYVTKPSEKNYPLGAEDPAYIADMEKYDKYKVDSAMWNVNKYVYEGEFYLKYAKMVAKEAVPEYTAITEFVEAAIGAVKAFDLNHSDYKKAVQADKMFNSMSEMQQSYANNMSLYFYGVYKVASYGPTYEGKRPKDLLVLCNSIENYKTLSDFEELVNSVQPPYTEETLAKVVEAYKNVPDTFKGEINKSVTEKYNDILFTVLSNERSQEKPDITKFEKTTVKYPVGTNHDRVEAALPLIEKIIFEKLQPVLGLPKGGLTDVVKTKLYTNATVASITSMLYKLLGGLSNLIAYSPADLAKKLTETQYSGAVTALNNAAAQNTSSDKLAGWDYFTMKNGDMFEDGNREEFLDAMSAMFRQLSLITMAITLPNTFSATSVTYKYGGYEDLVPIFEALGVECMSSKEYTQYAADIKAKDSNMTMDGLIRPILMAVCNLVDTVAENPVVEISNLLPKLSYALKTDLIDTQIHKLASKVGMVTIPEFSLKTEDLFNMIAPALQSIKVNDTTTLSITLDKDKFLKFVNDEAGCGSIAIKDSISGFNAYRADIESDKADAFLILFRYAYGEITTDDNISSIKAFIDSSDMDTFQKLGAKAAVSALAVMPSDVAFSTLINIANPPKSNVPSNPGDSGNTTTPPATTKPSGSNGNANNDSANSSNSANTITNNPGIPKTGERIAAIFVSAAIVSAAGAVVAIKLRKKDDN